MSRGTVVFQPGSNAPVSEIYIVTRFNYSTKETFKRDGGQWRLDDTRSDSTNSSRNRAIANALFRAAYRMNFYN